MQSILAHLMATSWRTARFMRIQRKRSSSSHLRRCHRATLPFCSHLIIPGKQLSLPLISSAPERSVR